MNTVYLWLSALSLAFTLTACDNRPPAAAQNLQTAIPPIETEIETPQALKLNVNQAILKGLQQSADEPVSLSDALQLKIRPVEDKQRLSVSGELLMQQTWQANYLDNIDGGKLELQLRFDD